MVLNGRPAMNAPTERKINNWKCMVIWSILLHAFCHKTIAAYLPFAIRATMACDVPQKLEGALSLAITPNKAIGPYEENPNAAPRIKIQSCSTERFFKKWKTKTLKMANSFKSQSSELLELFTSFSETPVRTETGWRAKTHSGASWGSTHNHLTNTRQHFSHKTFA